MPDQNDLPALDDDVRALLADAKAIPALDAATKATLFARVEAKLDPVPPSDGGSSNEGGAPGAQGRGHPSLPVGSATVALATKGTLATVALALAIGAIAGVAIDRAILAASPAPAPPLVVTTSVPPAAVSVTTAAPEGVPVSLLPSAPPATPEPRSSASSTPAPEAAVATVSARGLGAERALLDVARSALARGEPQEALEAADRHERQYGDGALIEEREAIAIKSLVALGRRDEARKRAVVFERRFPNGLMLRAVKASVDAAQ